MTRGRLVATVALALAAFAGNSLLCRLALRNSAIDPATFTSLRMVAGSAMLWLILRNRGESRAGSGSWWSALALFAYAAGFSFAYLGLPAGTGALLLFGAVQATMIGYGLASGERLRAWQTIGLLLSVAGLVALLLPGISAPPLTNSVLMLGAGVAWGVYSIRGRSAGDPTRTTAGNFVRTVPFAIALSAVMLPSLSIDASGAILAVASGALTSGLGYVVWYTAVKRLTVTQASTAQLSVPMLTALGGVALLGEQLTLRLLCCSVLILGGIALVISARQSVTGARRA